jgi:hypothetical protein
MNTIESFVTSQQQEYDEIQSLQEWELALNLGTASEKCCHTINLYSGVPVVPMALMSKESKSFLSKLMESTRDRVYALHRMIMILYTPSVLKDTEGLLSIKLLSRDTNESTTVVKDHPVHQAAAFVCRWPRAVLAKSAGLALLAAFTGVDIKKGGLVGVLSPYWEDKLSTKMVYEKQLPSKTFPLEEQDPAFYIKDLKQLRAVVAARIHLGGSGQDLAQQPISIAMPNTILPANDDDSAGPQRNRSRKGKHIAQWSDVGRTYQTQDVRVIDNGGIKPWEGSANPSSHGGDYNYVPSKTPK